MCTNVCMFVCMYVAQAHNNSKQWKPQQAEAAATTSACHRARGNTQTHWHTHTCSLLVYLLEVITVVTRLSRTTVYFIYLAFSYIFPPFFPYRFSHFSFGHLNTLSRAELSYARVACPSCCLSSALRSLAHCSQLTAHIQFVVIWLLSHSHISHSVLDISHCIAYFIIIFI